MQIVNGGARGQPIRRRIKVERGAARFGVETLIDQQHSVVAVKLGRRRAVPIAMRAAHFEQIGKVVLEHDRQPQVDRLVAIIAHAEPLIGGATPQEDGAQDMDAVLLHKDTLAVHQIRIGQIDEERRIIVAQVGAEQERRLVVHQEFETRQVPRILVKQTTGVAG